MFSKGLILYLRIVIIIHNNAEGVGSIGHNEKNIPEGH